MTLGSGAAGIGTFVMLVIVRVGVSTLSDQISDTIQPMIDQPKRRFRAATAAVFLFCLIAAIIVGRK